MADGAPPPTAGSSGGVGLPPPPSSSTSGLPPPPKILLAKPPTHAAAARPDDPSSATAAGAPVVLRSRGHGSGGSLNLLSPPDSWDLHVDRALPFLTENTDFTVIGIIGPPGVGKSTILNELYGFDAYSTGMLPPFPTQTDETRQMARHCTAGIELRASSERLILLDVQPIFSPSILLDMIRPDGSSLIPVLGGESLSADLAHELMGIQLGVFLASVCNILIVASEGVHDLSMWHLMLTVDLLKHGIPDPSSLHVAHLLASIPGTDKESMLNVMSASEEYMASLVFVHTKLQDQDLSPSSIMLMKKSLSRFFSTALGVTKCEGALKTPVNSSSSLDKEMEQLENTGLDLFFLPLKVQEESQKVQSRSFTAALGKFRDQILGIYSAKFAKPLSEREWLKNSAKIWELVKKSPVITDYSRTLQNSGLFRK